jgi:membrane protein insertase Oxa1/YidC/SpoIIIJ
MIFFFTVSLPAALPLYWLVGGLVAYIQQSIVLREDEEEMEARAESGTTSKDVGAIPEAEIVETETAPARTPKPTPKKPAKKKGNKRRRK